MTPTSTLRTLVVGDLSSSLLRLLFYYPAEKRRLVQGKGMHYQKFPSYIIRRRCRHCLDQGRLSQTLRVSRGENSRHSASKARKNMQGTKEICNIVTSEQLQLLLIQNGHHDIPKNTGIDIPQVRERKERRKLEPTKTRMISSITTLSTKTTKPWNSRSYLDPTNATLLRLPTSFTHLLAKDQAISLSMPSKATESDLQERQGDVTVDLRLDGDLDLEVEVKAQLQSCGWSNSLALRAADDLSAEDGRGLGRSTCWSFYANFDTLPRLGRGPEQRYTNYIPGSACNLCNRNRVLRRSNSIEPRRREEKAPSQIWGACESTVYRIQTKVKDHDRFWLECRPYSVYDNNATAQFFDGGTVYQAFLSPQDYHCWHSPVDGKITRAEVVPGTYYAVLPDDGAKDGDPHGAIIRSQAWLTHSATRAIIYIKADNPDIGLVTFIGVGMVEVSACDLS
ncbi:hypothetical protein ARMGADRAFT_1091070, partial [Armillaria gallica]